MYRRLRERWQSEAGYREFFVLALPLILSTASWSLLHFVDRMFLAWYSPAAIAASMPAGILNFTLVSLFIGTASYAGTFVAQYYGAGQHNRIGPVIWQGVYVSALGALIILAFIPLADPIFSWVGHDAKVQQQECIYFQILSAGAFAPIAASALAGFFSGLGRPWPVMWVNLLTNIINLVLDVVFIFGYMGCPEMGIAGAALATVIAGGFSLVFYLFLLFRPDEEQRYRTRSGWRFDTALFARLMRFGLPAGVQFSLEMAGFTAFVLLVGRLGTTALAATNIAFNINTLAFMPMVGSGIAISVLVGQYVGMCRTDLAQKAVYSGAHITLTYMFCIALLYVLTPEIFVGAYAVRAGESFAEIAALAVILLRFVAVYSVSDGMNIIFSSALKGAGDTRFVMVIIVFSSISLLIVPTWVAIIHLHAGIMACWTIATAYIIIIGLIFLIRFQHGAWKNMSLVEPHTPAIPPVCAESPDIRVE